MKLSSKSGRPFMSFEIIIKTVLTPFLYGYFHPCAVCLPPPHVLCDFLSQGDLMMTSIQDVPIRLLCGRCVRLPRRNSGAKMIACFRHPGHDRHWSTGGTIVGVGVPHEKNEKQPKHDCTRKCNFAREKAQGKRPQNTRRHVVG